MTKMPRLVALLVLLTGGARAGTFNVSSAADSGPGSLRQAIADANANGSVEIDLIYVSSSDPIVLLSPLPPITTPTRVQRPAGQLAVIDGRLLNSGSGLRFETDRALVVGITLVNFPDNGIEFVNSRYLSALGNTIGGISGTPPSRQMRGAAILVEGGGPGRITGNIIGNPAGDGSLVASTGIRLIDLDQRPGDEWSDFRIISGNLVTDVRTGIHVSGGIEVVVDGNAIGHREHQGQDDIRTPDGYIAGDGLLIEADNVFVGGTDNCGQLAVHCLWVNHIGNARHAIRVIGDENHISGNQIEGIRSHAIRISGTANVVDTQKGEEGWNFTNRQSLIVSAGGDGLRIDAGSTLVRTFSFSQLGGLPIDNGGDGADVNDLLDADGGPNSRLNHPIITSAVRNGTGAVVTGTYQGAPNAEITIRAVGLDGCPAANAITLDSTPLVITTDANGEAAFTLPAHRAYGLPFSSVALMASHEGNSSELSPCFVVGSSQHDEAAPVPTASELGLLTLALLLGAAAVSKLG